MSSYRLRIGVAVVFLAAAAAVGAQQPPPAQPPARPGIAPRVAQPPGSPVQTPVFRAKQVLGSKVFIQGDVNIGTVEDLVFDDAGNLEYMIVANAGQLVTVPWEAAKFNFEQRTATLSITADQYKAIPTYTTTTYPEFWAPAYRTEVYQTFGLRPRELRRLERRGVIP